MNPHEFQSMSLEEEPLMEAEEATLNSKPRSESTTKKDDVSFYFGRM